MQLARSGASVALATAAGLFFMSAGNQPPSPGTLVTDHTIEVSAPQSTATETLTIGYTGATGAAGVVSVTVNVAASMSADQKASALADAADTAASQSSHPVNASASGNTISVSGTSGATIGSIAITNNSQQTHKLTAPPGSALSIAVTEFSGAVSGVRAGDTQASSFTIDIGETERTFDLGNAPSFQSLSSTIRTEFEAAGIDCTLGVHGELIFELPTDAPFIELVTNDRTLRVAASVGVL